MKEILSITDLAKLRGVSTETLRHYDRIGLLKPYKVNEDTKERYYSIYQYEELGTIKELKQLGFSLKEIKEYLDNRNIETTHHLLTKNLDIIDEKIDELLLLKKKIEYKIDFLNTIQNIDQTEEFNIKEILSDRLFLLSDNPISNEIELSYEAIKLENIVSDIDPYLPIFASNRYIGFFHDYQMNQPNNPLLGITISNKEYHNEVDELKKVPKGKYLTKVYNGSFWDGESHINQMIDYATKHKIKLSSDIIQTQWLDYTFVNDKDNLIYEIQIRIE